MLNFEKNTSNLRKFIIESFSELNQKTEEDRTEERYNFIVSKELKNIHSILEEIFFDSFKLTKESEILHTLKNKIENTVSQIASFFPFNSEKAGRFFDKDSFSRVLELFQILKNLLRTTEEHSKDFYGSKIYRKNRRIKMKYKKLPKTIKNIIKLMKSQQKIIQKMNDNADKALNNFLQFVLPKYSSELCVKLDDKKEITSQTTENCTGEMQ